MVIKKMHHFHVQRKGNFLLQLLDTCGLKGNSLTSIGQRESLSLQ